MDRSFADKLVLVTGASRGIGWHTALAFADAGAHIVAVARTTGGLEELDDEIQRRGASATLVPVDLTDFEAIDRLGAALFDRWGKLDVLVANAGMLGTLSPLGHIEPKTWDKLMHLNITANWRLIRSLDPLLRRADAGRAIFVTSAAAQECRAFWGGYSVTKAALDALARTYAAETQSTAVRVALIAPGPTRTAMRAQAMPGEDPNSVTDPADIAPHIFKLASPQFDQTGAVYDCRTGNLTGGLA